MELEQPHAIDVIASGIHDIKNELFDALARIGAARQSIHADEPAAALPVLAETEVALSAAAERLSKLLSAYRLARHENPVAMVAVDVSDLVEDVLIRVGTTRRGIELASDVRCKDAWICDRELVADSLVNALQNALRHARSAVRIEADVVDAMLRFSIADDGPGFPTEMPAHADGTRSGVGLFIARRIAALHFRHGRKGHLAMSNGGALGGAIFTLDLP
jgi:signal transduction histidine kinase